MSNNLVLSGYLYKLNNNLLFKTWSRKYVEIIDDTIYYYTSKGSLPNGLIKLTTTTTCDDSLIRLYCFQINDKSNKDNGYFAASDLNEKTKWIDKIKHIIKQLNVLERKKQRYEQFVSNNNNKANLYIRILKGKDVIDKESNNTLDRYLSIIVGSSIVKTEVKKRNSFPEWNCTYQFEIDRSFRYAKIEIWNRETTSEEAVGIILIPLLSLHNGYQKKSWYHINKKSTKVSISGEIEIDIWCNGIVDTNNYSYKLFTYIRYLPEFVLQLLPNDKESNNYIGFPYYFPPIETEVIEDFCVYVYISCLTYTSKVNAQGILFLTNYRLIFVTMTRLYSNNSNLTNDLSTQIPLGSISSINLTTESEMNVNMNTNIYDVIKIKTSDQRSMSFIYRSVDEIDGFIDIDRKVRSRSISTTNLENYNNLSNKSNHLSSKDDFSNIHSMITQIWSKIINEPDYLLDSADSYEGTPFNRIYNRINLFLINRINEQMNLLSLHKELITTLLERIRNGNDTDINDDIHTTVNDNNYSISKILDSNNDINIQSNDIFKYLDLNSDKHISISSYIQHLNEIPLSRCRKLWEVMYDSWHIYNPLNEFKRLGIPDSNWRISLINVRYELCPTYPKLLIVPKDISDDDLSSGSSFRSKNRMPTLVWINQMNKCTISRCSQPLVGLGQNRNTNDEKLIEAIQLASTYSNDLQINNMNSVPSANLTNNIKPLLIIDCRPLLNATANQAAGKGFESEKFYSNTTVLFMDIPNIHIVRKSTEMLEDACDDEAHWLKNLDASGYFSNLLKILRACIRIVHSISYEDRSVVIHCSDGWDRTSQVTSISMMLLDPYYRTLHGFIVLIEKEWLSFGHKFSDRLGWRNGYKDDERSGIFIQFLDCVYQCMSQSPSSYEFNEDLLLFIANYMQSGWFGNFLSNSEKERESSKNDSMSIWLYIFNNKSKYINVNYSKPSSNIVVDIVVPVVTKHRITIWSKFYLSWHEKIWHITWLQSNDLSLDTSNNPLVIWKDDKNVKGCYRCHKSFTFYRRKHHCRLCGLIFCENCANESRLIKHISIWKTSRCCKDCAYQYDSTKNDSESNDIITNNLTTNLSGDDEDNNILYRPSASSTNIHTVMSDLSIDDNQLNINEISIRNRSLSMSAATHMTLTNRSNGSNKSTNTAIPASNSIDNLGRLFSRKSSVLRRGNSILGISSRSKSQSSKRYNQEWDSWNIGINIDQDIDTKANVNSLSV